MGFFPTDLFYLHIITVLNIYVCALEGIDQSEKRKVEIGIVSADVSEKNPLKCEKKIRKQTHCAFDWNCGSRLQVALATHRLHI